MILINFTTVYDKLNNDDNKLYNSKLNNDNNKFYNSIW